MDASVFREAAALEGARRPFVLCTVVATERSAPRDAGARMLVRDDGSFVGTVGGGPLEAAILVEARALLERPDGKTALFEAQLTTDGDVHLGMKCGGAAQVLLDVHRPSTRVVVLGAGHVGLKVVEVARAAGLDVHAMDDRDDRLAMLPDGVPRTKFQSDDVGAALQETGPADMVVIVTRCHAVDQHALAASMRSRVRYIGLIGSKRKVAVISKDLVVAQGLDPQADPRVYAPIGLDVGDKSPGEIAISVVGELLAVRDGKSLSHKRLPRRDAPRRRRLETGDET